VTSDVEAAGTVAEAIVGDFGLPVHVNRTEFQHQETIHFYFLVVFILFLILE
jgi:hypothetical protein